MLTHEDLLILAQVMGHAEWRSYQLAQVSDNPTFIAHAADIAAERVLRAEFWHQTQAPRAVY